jgi:diguanylate cyclase (GGDEF)-like protein/PAS domain S-box-containing protein
MGHSLVRYLLPAVIVVPAVLGWLRLEAERAGLYGTEVGVALMTAANVLIGSTLVLLSARLLDRLEDKRRQAEGKYRSIFESAAEGIFRSTFDGRLLSVNPAMAHMFGYESPEEMTSLISDTGKQLWASAEERAEYVHRLREQGVVVGAEVRMKRKDGSVVWVSATARALEDLEGKPTGLEGTLEDVTQRRQAEEALRRSGERFRSLIQNSSDIITCLEADGTILYESPSIERILGYEPGELISENVFDYIHPDDLGQVLEVFAEGLADPTLRPCLEYRFRHKDGSWRWLESIGANLLDDPIVGELVVNSRDITERKRVHDRLTESERRLSTLLSNAPTYLYRCRNEPGWPNEFVSDYALELTGYTPKELTDGSVMFGDVIVEKDRQRVWEEVQEALERRERFELQYAIRRKDGKIRHVEERGQGVYSDDREAVAIEGVVYDVTERAQAQEALREAKERYRTLVERIPAVTFIDRAEDSEEPLYVSPQIEAMVGYTPEEWMAGRLWRERLHPDDRDRILASDERFAASGEPVDEEYRLLAKDGSVVWVREETVLVRGEAGEPLFVQGILSDVTERKRAEEALKEAEVRFRTLAERIPAVTYIQADDDYHNTLYVSPQVQAMTGYSPEDFESHPGLWYDIVHPDDRNRVEAEDERTDRTGEPFRAEYRLLAGDARVVWVQDEAVLIENEHNSTRYWQGIMLDITRRKEAEEALREAEVRYRTLVEQIPAVTYINPLSETSRSTYISPQVEELLGYSVEESKRDPELWDRILHPDDRARVVAEEARTSATGEPFKMEYRMIARDGRVVWIRDEAVLVRDEEGRPRFWQGVMSDITDRKALEEQLTHQALHDALTGLPNRALFVDRLKQALPRAERRSTKVAVLFMDLDNFKVINDSLGHEAGDELLVGVSKRLLRCLRPEDTAARLGGDEFVVLLEDLVDTGEAMRVAKRIMSGLQAPFTLDGRNTFVSASVGIALSDSGQSQSAELLRDADAAMYKAKEDCGLQIFEPSMHTRATSRLELENSLRHALERGEFEVYYQPQVDLQTGRTVGFESLVRWHHPERGLVSPSEFIPVAEETGLITALGWWVLKEACNQAREWQERYPSDPPLLMNVNLSAKQLKRPDAVDTVERLLKETGLQPRCLSMDITETALIVAPENESTIALKRLRELGVRISIDDFGTGYSSLAYLRRLPADILKVDKSFVDGLGKDVEDIALVQLIVDTAHTLGMYVVAEGVESAEQAKQLKEMGCDIAQGYYFSEPLPPEVASAFLTKHGAVSPRRLNGRANVWR